MAGGDSEVIFGGEGGGVGQGALEESFCLGWALEVNEGVGAVVEEGGVGGGGGGIRGDKRIEEGFGGAVVAGAGEGAGEEAGDGGVVGVGAVEILEDGKGFFDPGGVIAGEVDGGQLGLEGGDGGVVGVGGYGCKEERLGLGRLVLAEEEVGESGGGVEGSGVAGGGGFEETAVGGLGDGEIAGGFG